MNNHISPIAKTDNIQKFKLGKSKSTKRKAYKAGTGSGKLRLVDKEEYYDKEQGQTQNRKQRGAKNPRQQLIVNHGMMVWCNFIFKKVLKNTKD